MLLTAVVLGGSPMLVIPGMERSARKADTMPSTQNRRRFLSALSAAAACLALQFQALRLREVGMISRCGLALLFTGKNNVPDQWINLVSPTIAAEYPIMSDAGLHMMPFEIGPQP